jgi:predicted nuclease of predicted toxin-antitoxin system
VSQLRRRSGAPADHRAGVSLLLDQNLSRHLVARLAGAYPGATHVALVGLDRASDTEVLVYARAQSLAVVSKDADFVDLVSLMDTPPKIIWLRVGNCSTDDVEETLRSERAAIVAFLADRESRVLELG